jgi:hypothetical protein
LPVLNRIAFGVLTAAVVALAIPIAIGIGKLTSSGGAATPHILDMTGEYPRVAFRGNLEIRKTEDYCVYRLPSLTVELMPNLPGIAESVYIDEVSMKVDRPRLPGEAVQLFVEKSPQAITLAKPGATGLIRNAEFRLSRPIAEITRYVLFALGGRTVIGVRPNTIGAGAPAQTIAGRAAWPMSARFNILSSTGDSRTGYYSIIRKTPSDPTDWCAPEKVH